MTTPAGASAPERARSVRWPWLAAAPLAWALHELVSYAGSSLACHADHGAGPSRLLGLPSPNLVVAVVSLVALGTAVLATARLWRWWRAHRDAPGAERPRFMVVVAAALGVLCVYGVLLAAVAMLLRGCA